LELAKNPHHRILDDLFRRPAAGSDVTIAGKDEDSAWNNLKVVLRVHVQSCFAHWQEGLTFRAAQAQFDLFDKLKEQQQNFRSDKIEFRLTPPKRPDVAPLHPLWMQGVEWVEGVGHGADQAAAVPAIN
jgi:hypothetical protein